MGTSEHGGKRLTRRAIQGGMAALGALGLAGGMAGAAWASGNTQSLTDTFSYTCTVTTPAITLTDQTATVTLNVTAPQQVSPGQSFTVSATSQTTLPSIIAATASGLGITSVTVESVKADVNATNVTPTSTTDTNTQTPTVTTKELTSPISVALAPLTFTAGSTPGTATFTAGDINVVSLIHGGQLNGDDATLSCTPPSNNTIGTVSIVKSTTSTVPVGAVGGAALAGLLGVGGGVAYVVRRRRTSPVANGIR
ncbi:hypothetical protein ACFFRE_06565 [Aciditerrimonas ferrireducens]|jgi:hypothetical protein|uniref:Uncharacterized protein n=1 Tax=Aciditerrimonas ferrireducens TaxID=667306 RepID=A0ABV6C6B3_9ACTN